MAEQLVRKIPNEFHSWLQQEARERNTSQQDLALDLLMKGREADSRHKYPLFQSLPLPLESEPGEFVPFTYVDLFAGIGGFRQAMDRLNGKCVLTVEWDKYCQKVYQDWYGDKPKGDITSLDIEKDIPDHDILCAGFPCQPFSIAGVSKKKSLGRAHGFQCVNQGNLFFILADIIEEKRPPVIFLENVKNLKSHDSGNTWKVIESRLKKLEYDIHPQIIDAAGWVPQHRERIYIVGFDQRVFGEKVTFKFPSPPSGRQTLLEILEKKPDPKYTLTPHLWNYLQAYAKKHQEKGNGFGFGLVDPRKPEIVTRTLSARYFKDGSEILIYQDGKNPRRLTPLECQRLQGFDDRLKITDSVSDTQAYKQLGNAVVPKVVEAVARKILKVVAGHLVNRKNGCLLKRGGNGIARMRKSG
jgi:DNA (cytosine-5)-methyltransferase 1